MTLNLINANAIKLTLLRQFYGLEEYIDLRETLPEMINALDGFDSEFSFISTLSNLDLWFIKITNIETAEIWNPFSEPLGKYADRYDFLTAHIYAEKQWQNKHILKFLGLPETE